MSAEQSERRPEQREDTWVPLQMEKKGTTKGRSTPREEIKISSSEQWTDVAKSCQLEPGPSFIPRSKCRLKKELQTCPVCRKPSSRRTGRETPGLVNSSMRASPYWPDSAKAERTHRTR